MNALEKAISIAGNQTKLAKKLGVNPMTVTHWVHRNKGIVPSGRVEAIYQATGVTPYELRPDIHPNPTSGLPQESRP